MLTITVEDYRSSAELDADLARLAFVAVQGWPDQMPIDAALVRSLLRPAGMTATTLVLHRDGDGRLLAVAALRWPATLDEPGRFWGPLVHPDGRGHGLGHGLMEAIGEVLAAHPGVGVRTTDIPESRAEGYALFDRAGWRIEATDILFERDLAVAATEASGPAAAVAVRSFRTGDYVAPALAALVEANRPDLGTAAARDTFARWSADSRYTPDGLLLAEDGDRLLGAAIVYPTRRASPADPLSSRTLTPLSSRALNPLGSRTLTPAAAATDESEGPTEALLGHLLTAPDLTPDVGAAVRTALVAAAVRVGVASGATVGRAVVDDELLAATLREAGYHEIDRVRRYAWPA